MGESPFFASAREGGDHKSTLRKRLYFLAPIGENYFYFDEQAASGRDEPRFLASL
jgi:hypothetical protein